jgi:hypothetical protein
VLQIGLGFGTGLGQDALLLPENGYSSVIAQQGVGDIRENHRVSSGGYAAQTGDVDLRDAAQRPVSQSNRSTGCVQKACPKSRQDPLATIGRRAASECHQKGAAAVIESIADPLRAGRLIIRRTQT